MSTKSNLDKLLKSAKKDLSWKKKAEYELANKKELDRSFALALAILKQLKNLNKKPAWLAKELNCSRQYVSKILKGKENLTLSTIYKIEEVIGCQLLQVTGLQLSNSTHSNLSQSKFFAQLEMPVQSGVYNENAMYIAHSNLSPQNIKRA